MKRAELAYVLRGCMFSTFTIFLFFYVQGWSVKKEVDVRWIEVCTLFDCDMNPEKEVSFTGAWCPTKSVIDIHNAFFDEPLALAISKFLTGKSVADFGAGSGRYVLKLREKKEVSLIDGYDGMPNVDNLTQGAVRQRDLTEPLGRGMPSYDWVMSLEVGEHVRKEKEETFLKNICSHAREGVILSWAVPNQGGTGHVNNQPNDYVIARMAEQSFTFQNESTQSLRKAAGIGHFHDTLMVFRKMGGGSKY